MSYAVADISKDKPTADGSGKKIIIRRIEKPKESKIYLFIKRIFDIIASFIASIILVIPMCFIALLIKIDSPGPALYKQERLSKNGKPFMLYKFRTMRTDAEAGGARWAEENDDRCTRLGAVLRKFRLDELPQFPFNILTGDISIVGPRPERECFYKEFATYIDGFEQRLYVKPGLTGLAQISGGYYLKPEEKVVYDLEYIENRSIFMDLMIILKTVAIVFNHDGAR